MKIKLYLFMLCFGSLLFFNCQTDDNTTEANNHSKFSMKRISFEEMKSKPKAVEALNKIRETKKIAGAQAKLVYDSANDFYVDTDEIIYIEKGGDYHSYTFAVYRDVEIPLFENLVMSLQKDGSYSATLVSYNLTEQEKKALEEEKLYSLEGKLRVKILDPGTYNPEYLLGRTNCYNVNVATCSQGTSVHIAGPGCTRVDGYVTLRVCYEYEEPVFYFDDTATGDTGGGTGDSGGGGGTGNPNPDPDPTPDTDPEDEEPEEGLGDAPVTIPLIKNPKGNPCEELKKLMENTAVKNTYTGPNGLQSKVTATKEYGFAFRTFPNSTGLQTPQAIASDPNDPTHLKVTNYLGGDYIGGCHTHTDPIPTKAIAMFSPQDIRYLAVVANLHNTHGQPKDHSIYVFTMTVAAGTFAIKIKNWDKLRTFVENPVDFADFNAELEAAYKKSTPAASTQTLQKNILTMMNKFDIGVGLYKANADMSNWSELTLNPNNINSNPIETPCN